MVSVVLFGPQEAGVVRWCVLCSVFGLLSFGLLHPPLLHPTLTRTP